MTDLVILQFDLFGILSNLNAFLIFMMLLIGIVGFAISEKAAIGGYGTFLVFIYIAMNTDLFIFNGLMYSIIVIMLIVIGFWTRNFVFGEKEVAN